MKPRSVTILMSHFKPGEMDGLPNGGYQAEVMAVYPNEDTHTETTSLWVKKSDAWTDAEMIQMTLMNREWKDV